MVLVDTSVLIDYFRKQDKSQTFLYALAGQHSQIYISAITKFEIWVGNRPEQTEFWRALFASLITLPFGDQEAELAGEIQQKLIKTNRQIGISDLLIGATGMLHQLPVATLNVKHFERVEGLEVVGRG